MLYAAELFYLQDRHDVPFQEAVLVTATTVAQWCTHFRARLLSYPKGYTDVTEEAGRLPLEAADKERFVAGLVTWLFEHSTVKELFYLLLDDRPVPQKERIARFQHPDDTCCWLLNLAEDEFAMLQEAWRRNGLPADLFYPAQAMRCIPYPGRSLKSKLWRALGVKRCYTPLQWQTRSAQNATG